MMLPHLFEYQQLTGRKNEFGEIPEEHKTVFILWGSLEPLTHTETDRAAAVGRTTTHRLKCHYDKQITSAGRFKSGSRIFDIISVINEGERNKVLDIRVAEHA